VRTSARIVRRSVGGQLSEDYGSTNNDTRWQPDSMRLRKVVHVVGPDDLPEFSKATSQPAGSTIYGNISITIICDSL